MESLRRTRKLCLPTRTPLVFSAALCCVTLLAPPAQAAFHLWQIREIYTDATGTRQFIELFCPSSGQTFVNGQQITVSSGGSTHTFTLNHGLPGGGDSLNHALLFATSGAQPAGAPAPDYTLTDSFLFAGGGTISFFGANSGSYTALPTDGVQSRNWSGGNTVNNPQNFAGTVGFVAVPEPATWALFAVGAFGIGTALRRRS